MIEIMHERCATLLQVFSEFHIGHKRSADVSLRRIRENWREAPATYSIGALWVLVFLLMLVCQSQGILGRPETNTHESLGPLGIGAISETTGQAFGAWNSAEILAGQIWRTILATFVHFGVVHIALNLFGLLQLGRLIEEWYGPRLTLAIFIITGFLGNSLAALARPIFGQPSPHLLQITSGGGSTVIFGLIGLVAMVGKRSRSRMGRYLYNQMVGLLIFNFLIGLTIPQIDNYAHAGGAIAGAIIGLFHHRLLGWVDHRMRLCRVIQRATIAILCLCVLAQVRVNQVNHEIEAIEKRLLLIGNVAASLNNVRSGYINRAILGIRTVQVVHQKPRVQLPYFPPLQIPLPDTMIDENRMRLDSSIDHTNALVHELNAPAINPAWTGIRDEARLAVARPPHAKEIGPFVNSLTQLDQTLRQLSVDYLNKRIALGKKQIIWRMPWPGIVWKELGPELKVIQQMPAKQAEKKQEPL